MDQGRNIEKDDNQVFRGGKENNFLTPASYFDNLPSRITDRVQASGKKEVFIFRPGFAISALIAGILVIAILLFLRKDELPAEITLSENDIEHVIDNPEAYGLDEDIIKEKFLSSDISYEVLSDEAEANEEEIRDYLEESTTATNIIHEY